MDYCFIIDFEATEEGEIIEFACIVINTEQKCIIDTFHHYVKPQTELTQKITQLTGIDSKMLSNADTFDTVNQSFQTFFEKYQELSEWEDGPMIITCGDWDFKYAYDYSCRLWNIENKFREWCDLKQVFKSIYKKARGMKDMLEFFGLKLEGKHHRGIDDAKTITQIVLTMINEGLLSSFVVTSKN